MRRPSLVVAGVCTGWGTTPILVRRLDMSSTVVVAARLWLAGAGAALIVFAGALVVRSAAVAEEVSFAVAG